MSDHQLNANIQRHKSLYFDDGDIVLAALTKGHPERRTVFRVDKIFLARHSPIFRDMLSFSPGQGPHDTYDGVPRVDLADDAEDLQGLLGAMYNVGTLPLRKFDPDKPLRLMGTMRLAIKYEVDSIRDLIKRSVEEDWSHDPESYDVWTAERTRIKQKHNSDWLGRVPEPAAALQFAIEFECSNIFTGIIYYLATFGNESYSYRPTLEASVELLQIARWHLLDAVSLFHVVKAREILRERMLAYEVELVHNIDNRDCCRLGHVLRDYVYPDIMQSHSSVLGVCRYEGVCETCLGDITDKTSVDEWRQSLWEELSKHNTAMPAPWPELPGLDDTQPTG